MGLLAYLFGRGKPKLHVSSYYDSELRIQRFMLVARRGYMSSFGGFTNDPSRAHPFDTEMQAVMKAHDMGYSVRGYRDP
jgi:hypothetical protein